MRVSGASPLSSIRILAAWYYVRMKRHVSFDQAMERVFHYLRYVVMIPVVSLALTSVFIMVWTLTNYVFLGDIFDLSERDLIVGLISIVDLFLIGILTLMIAVSLYALYVDESPDDVDQRLPNALIVNSLDELKNKLGKVVYLILLITFFKYAIQYEYQSMQELFLLAGAILLISLSLYFQKGK